MLQKQQLLVTQPRATGNAPPRLLSNAHLRSAQRRMAPILDSKGECLLRIFSNSTAVSICTMITFWLFNAILKFYTMYNSFDIICLSQSHNDFKRTISFRFVLH